MIGGPVAMKLSAPGLIHKTEVGGVRLGLRGREQAAAAFEEMTSAPRLARFGLAADGVFVQEMVPDGLDLLVSAHGDEVFGPVLTIGAGGVAAEVDRDVAHLAIPFDDAELARALRGLRLWPLLAGFRGRPPCDLSVLAGTARAIADVYARRAVDRRDRGQSAAGRRRAGRHELRRARHRRAAPVTGAGVPAGVPRPPGLGASPTAAGAIPHDECMQ